MSTLAERVLERARALGALQYGDFVLTSGQRSGYYFDGRLLSLDPVGARLVAQAVLERAWAVQAQAVGGPAMGAIPIVGAVVLLSGLQGRPLTGFFVRPRAKEHGTGRQVEGPLRPGQRVVVLDDVCTTGGSLLTALEAVEAMGCTVALVMAVLDRKQGGSDALRARGYPFTALLEATPEGEVRPVPPGG